MFGVLLGSGPAGKRVPPSPSPPPSPPRLPRSLPDQQLPKAAGPAAPSRGHDRPPPRRPTGAASGARSKAASGTLPALLASQRLRKKGGRDPCPRGRLPPGSPCFSPRLQPFSQTQLGSRELSRSRSHPDPTWRTGLIFTYWPWGSEEAAGGRAANPALGPKKRAHPRATARCYLMNECGERGGTSPLPEQPLHAGKAALRSGYNGIRLNSFLHSRS